MIQQQTKATKQKVTDFTEGKLRVLIIYKNQCLKSNRRFNILDFQKRSVSSNIPLTGETKF